MTKRLLTFLSATIGCSTAMVFIVVFKPEYSEGPIVMAVTLMMLTFLEWLNESPN